VRGSNAINDDGEKGVDDPYIVTGPGMRNRLNSCQWGLWVTWNGGAGSNSPGPWNGVGSAGTSPGALAALVARTYVYYPFVRLCFR